MHKIRGQVVILFLLLLTVSMTLSGGITALFSHNQNGSDLQQSLSAQRLLALDLAKKSELDNEEICQILSSSIYRIRQITDEEAARLRDSQMKQIMNGAHTKIGNRVVQVFQMRDDIMIVELNFEGTFMFTALIRMMISGFFTTVIAIVIVVLLSKWMVKPIEKLTCATRAVAAGDYDVRVNADERILLSRDNEMNELMRNFNHMVEELGGVEYLRRDFTSSVSHEIKSPIATISGYARLLQESGITDEDRAELTGAIMSEAKRLANLSDNLLKLTRLESQQIQPPLKKYSLSEQLRQILTSIIPEIEAKQIALQIDLPELQIVSDAELLSHVWSNLLSNAVKFTPEGGKIELRAAPDVDEIWIRVQDNGMGMNEEALGHAFEKFYQADLSRHSGGSGLGLPLVKRIVTILGGRIDAQSTPGQGSSFTVRLPK